MEVVNNAQLLPGDPRLVDHIVGELKSQGIFDQFRKECIADVDTKPAYQNLRQRVDGNVSNFLSMQKWKSDMNKNQVREMLRKNIQESGFLETGVERIVDQVVNPKINTTFFPQVEDVVYKFLGMEKPEKSTCYDKNKSNLLSINTTDLLPTDLDPISPASDKPLAQNSGLDADKNDLKMEDEEMNDDQKMDDSFKADEEESPPFEPIGDTSFTLNDENTNDSNVSGISGLSSHASNMSTSDSKVKLDDLNLDYNSREKSDNIEEKIKEYDNEEESLKMDVSGDIETLKIEQNYESVNMDISSSDSNEDVIENSSISEVKIEELSIEVKEDISNNNDDSAVSKLEDKLKEQHEETKVELNGDEKLEDKYEVNEELKDFENTLESQNEEKENKVKDVKLEEANEIKTESDKRSENKETSDNRKSSTSSKDHRSSDKDKKRHSSSSSSRNRDKDKDNRSSHSSSSKDRKDYRKDEKKYDNKTDKESFKNREKDGKYKKDSKTSGSSSKDSSRKSRDYDSKSSSSKRSSSSNTSSNRDRKSSTSKDSSSRDRTKSSSSSKDRRDSSRDIKDDKRYKEKENVEKKHNKDEKIEGSDKNRDGDRNRDEKSSETKDKSREEKDKARDGTQDKNRDDLKDKNRDDMREKNRNDIKDNIRDETKDKNRDEKRKPDTKSKYDKEKINRSDSYDKEKNNKSESKHSMKSSSSSTSSKKDSKKESSSKKTTKDDHSSSREKNSDNRRSTDRDSNDGSSGNFLQNSSVVRNATNQKSKAISDNLNSQSGESGDPSSDSTTDKLEEKTEDLTNAAAKLPIKVDVTESTEVLLNTSSNGLSKGKKRSISDSLDMHQGQFSTQILDGQIQVKLKKPKFASNIFEARRLMKIRKRLEKLERKRQKQLNEAHQLECSLSPDANSLDSLPNGSISSSDELENDNSSIASAELEFSNSPHQEIDYSKSEENKKSPTASPKYMTNKFESKQSPTTESPKHAFSKKTEVKQTTSKSNISPKIIYSSDGEDCLYLSPKTSPSAERFLKEVATLQKRTPVISETDDTNSDISENSLNTRGKTSRRSRKPNLKYCSKDYMSEVKLDAAELNSEKEEDKVEKIVKVARNSKRKANIDESTENIQETNENNNIKVSKIRCQENIIDMEVSNKTTSLSIPIADQDIKPMKKVTKPRKSKKNINAVNESFVLPLSPESDASVTTPIVETKVNLRKESKDSKEEPNLIKVQKVDKIGKQALKAAKAATQRYSSDDLYKPRPVIGTTRRSRAAHNNSLP